MNSGTYYAIESELLKTPATEDASLWDAIKGDVAIDESVPDNMVRLAGDRYVPRDEFLRMQRREMRRR